MNIKKIQNIFSFNSKFDFGILGFNNIRSDIIKKYLENIEIDDEILKYIETFFKKYYKNGMFFYNNINICSNVKDVKLIWKNHDQYYVKTFDKINDYFFTIDGNIIRLNLTHIDMEKDNNKGNYRYIIDNDRPLVKNKNNELVINLKYINIGKSRKKQKTFNKEAVETIFQQEGFDEWLTLLKQKAPTEKNPDRTLLEKHLNDYTARNTFDYFIHKDLGSFLHRELDFYIKNEVLYLDDIDDAAFEVTEQHLRKIKVIRSIAHKIIRMLAQLEDFQKKLWLKKKFVVETNYCMTLDRIPEELYGEIASNTAQHEEWVKLGFTTEDTEITEDFFRENPFLVLDTKFFDKAFKEKLLSSIENLDEQCDGLLIHSENFQALNLLHEQYRARVKCVYVDPPYNTGEDGFVYKDSYRHSCWLSMMQDRTLCGKFMQSDDSSIYVSINEDELYNLNKLLAEVYGDGNYLSTFTVKVRHENRILKGDKDFHEVFENVVAYRKSRFHIPTKRIEDNTSLDEYVWDIEIVGTPLTSISIDGKEIEVYAPDSFALRKSEPNEHSLKRINIRGSLREGNSSGRFYVAHLEPLMSIYPGHLFKVPNMGNDALGYRFFWLPEEGSKRRNGDYFQGVPVDRKDTKLVPYPNLWDFEKDFNQCSHEGGINFRNGKKPIAFLSHILTLSGVKGKTDALVLDYFAGSGTTGHAVINLNREDGGKRKYILVEMGEYFDTVLKPRIQKVIYSKDWKDGKPKPDNDGNLNGISHCFKYLRLESYEDTLNNLILKPRTQQQDDMLKNNPSLREDYMLGYWLDVETADSPSLLNIKQFENPFDYKLNIATGSVGATKPMRVDLVETFNYLIGLTVKHIDTVRGFKVITGTNPKDESVLIIWRNLKEKDNTALEEFMEKQAYHPRDTEFDHIYVNGDHTLEDPHSKVKMIEIEFKRLMFDVQDV